MPILQVSLIISTVFLLSVGQILFKLASGNIYLSSVGFISLLMNFRLALAVLVYTFATILWIIALKDLPLRTVYPFAALAFFIVPVLAILYLGRHCLGILTWAK